MTKSGQQTVNHRDTHEKHTASLLNDLNMYDYNVKLLSKWEHGKQWE